MVGEVTLVCLAPLTNIALAIRTYSAFKKSLREVHIMGGNVRGECVSRFLPCKERGKTVVVLSRFTSH